MIKSLLDLSEKIDPDTIAILEEISGIASVLDILFYVVGARARDFVLYYGYGIDPIRATSDIDLGIQVSDWDQFNKLKNGLTAGGGFDDTEQPQRIIHYSGIPVDIIPFGGITDEENSYTWPTDLGFEMNVLGFKEAFDFSIPVRLRTNPNLDIQLASPAGLAMLKLISWNVERPNRTKDAQDLFLLIRNYIDAGNEDRFYNEIDTFQFDDEDYDYELASAQLLGRDIASIGTIETINRILQTLQQETNDNSQYTLISDMMKSDLPYQNFEHCLRLLKHLIIGIKDDRERKS